MIDTWSGNCVTLKGQLHCNIISFSATASFGALDLTLRLDQSKQGSIFKNCDERCQTNSGNVMERVTQMDFCALH